MLKKISYVILLLALSVSISAAPISKQTALLKAKSFVQERGFAMNLQEQRVLRAPQASGDNDNSPYYIFNSGDDQGFVIVAGDDLAYPIIGYSDKGTFDIDNIPDGLQALLDGYQEAIAELQAMEMAGAIDTTQGHDMKRVMITTKNPVEPFLTTYFGHYAPYYNKNPKYDGKTPCACACTTVAVAEVMAYFKYPATAPKAPGYTTETLGIELQDLPAYEINWNNILPNYTDFEYSQAQADEISRLMNHIGQSMQTDFQEDSATPSRMVYNVLRDYGYRSSNIISITGYLMNVWEDILYENFLKKQPVIVSGANIRIGGARHVFILDGYDQDGYYHADWGWNGCCQGYYNFSDISPYNNTNSYAYFKDLWLIYNIAPKNTPTSVEEKNLSASLDLTSLTVSNGKITTKRKNYNGFADTFLQGIGIVDKYNKLLKVLEWDSVYLKNSSETATRVWTVDDLSGFPDGEYSIYPVSRLADGDSIWHFDVTRYTTTNVGAKVVIADEVFKLSTLPTVKYNSFVVDEKYPFYNGAARIITLNLTNNSMDMVNKKLYLYEDSITPMQFASIDIPARSTINYDFTYLSTQKGTHKLWLCTDTLRSNRLYERTIKVVDAVKYSLKVDSIIFDNFDSSKNYLYGNELRVRFKLTNNGSNAYDDYFRVLLRKNSWYDTKKFLIHLPVGKSQWFEFESKDMAYFLNFTLYIYEKTSSSVDPNVFTTSIYSKTLVPNPSIRMWKTDGKMYAIPTTTKLTIPENVLALDLTAPGVEQPTQIVPNSNPNTLYYVTSPFDELEGYNQIVNGVADSIYLIDNAPCYVPLDFTANYAQYTRTFEKGFTGKINENNWSTIALPFNVDRVYNTVDSVEVTWYKPGEDGNFWLREFYGEEAFNAYFCDAEEMNANIPYIITVPDDYLGPVDCLVGKPLEFTGENTFFSSKKVVSDARVYDFQGAYYEANTYGKYIFKLNEEERGNYFAYIPEESTVQPFRAYFTSIMEPTKEDDRLFVRSYIKRNSTTDIKNVEETVAYTQYHRPALNGIYTITGRKVASGDVTSVKAALNSLPAGIYIINGKKYVK